MIGDFGPTDHRLWPSEREDMPPLRGLADRATRVAIDRPPLRGLADRATRVAIDMAPLAELFASPPLHRYGAGAGSMCSARNCAHHAQDFVFSRV